MEAWSLLDEDRQAFVGRAAAAIANVSFFCTQRILDRDARVAAEAAEKRAYSRALVESSTTTGSRPKEEVFRAYLRALSSEILDRVRDGAKGAATLAAGQDTTSLDLSTSGREFLTKELAAELLAPMLASGAGFQAIKLSTKSIGREASPTVCEAIANVAPTLQTADVSDIIAGRPEPEALAVLQDICASLASCSRLRHLNLSDNALGEKGIRACSAALSGAVAAAEGPEAGATTRGLASLRLMNIGCSAQACRAVGECLKGDGLELLHLHNNMSGDEGAAAIADVLSRNAHMEDFRMSSSRVGSDGMNDLSAALAKGSSLTSLDLSDNPADPSAGPMLASMLPRHNKLRSLVLNDLALGDEGVEALAGALAPPGACPLLNTLELGLNEITAVGAKALAATFLMKRQLHKVNLGENELQNEGAVCLAAALRAAAALEVLDVRSNEIGAVGAVAIARCCAAAKPGMQRLELDSNVISDAGVHQVEAILASAHPDKSVLGSTEENDPDSDPAGDVGDAGSAGMTEIEASLGRLYVV